MALVDDVVHLRRKSDQQIIKVPLKKLRAADQDYAQSLATLSARLSKNISEEKSAARTASELSRTTQAFKLASDVLKGYELFMHDASIPVEEKSKAQNLLKIWRERTNAQMIRAGKEWLTPAALNEAESKEKELLERANAALKAKKIEEFRDLLVDASRANPAGVEADYRLGLLYGLSKRSPGDAAHYFQKCLDRTELDLDLQKAALVEQFTAFQNNLAIAQFRQSKFGSALRNWEEAFVRQPASIPLIHNVALLHELAQAEGNKFSARDKAKIEELFQKAQKQDAFAAVQVNRGLLYAVQFAPELEDDAIRFGVLTKTPEQGLPDTGCLFCDAIGNVACPISKCKNGTIANMVERKIFDNGIKAQYRTEIVKSKCTECGGDGYVPCPRCNGRKRDPLFR